MLTEKNLKILIESLVKSEIEKINESMITEHPFLGGFLTPFLDIFRVAKAELSKVTSTAFENTKKLAKQAVFFSIPFIGTAAIKRAEHEAQRAIKQKISSINEEHREIYENIWNALKNPDVLGFTFLLDPVLPLTENFALAVKLVKDAPGPLLGALEVLTGGNAKIRELSQRYKKSRSGHTFSKGSGGGVGTSGFGDGFDFGGFGEANINKINEQQKDPYKILASEIQNILKNPDVQKSINNSPIVKEFREAGIKAIINTIKPIMDISSYEELERTIPNFGKIKTELDKIIPKENVSKEDIVSYQNNFVEEYKKIYKSMFITNLLKTFSGQSIVDNDFMKEIIKKIEAL